MWVCCCAFPRWRRVRGAIGSRGQGIGRALWRAPVGPWPRPGSGEGRGASLLGVGGFSSMVPPWGLSRGFCRGGTREEYGYGRSDRWEALWLAHGGVHEERRALLVLVVKCQAASPVSNPVPNCIRNAEYPGEATSSRSGTNTTRRTRRTRLQTTTHRRSPTGPSTHSPRPTPMPLPNVAPPAGRRAPAIPSTWGNQRNRPP